MSAFREDEVFEAQCLACALPCRRFADTLAGNVARFGADVVRYSFIVRDFTLYSLPVSRRTPILQQQLFFRRSPRHSVTASTSRRALSAQAPSAEGQWALSQPLRETTMLSLLSSRLARLAVLAVLAVVGIMLLADAGPAATRRLSGTYTAAQIKASCDASPGGIYNNGPYGASCISDKGSVTCDPKGRCTGSCAKCANARPIPTGTMPVVGAGTSGNQKGTGKRFLPPAG